VTTKLQELENEIRAMLGHDVTAQSAAPAETGLSLEEEVYALVTGQQPPLNLAEGKSVKFSVDSETVGKARELASRRGQSLEKTLEELIRRGLDHTVN
jgi:hypothetical protein